MSNILKLRPLLVLCCSFVVAHFLLPESLAFASESEAGHGDSIVPVLTLLLIIIFSARVGGDLALRVGLPEVLGELMVGVLIGNLGLLGFHAIDSIKTNDVIAALSEIGVILLLFEVGLETNIKEMQKVGLSSLLVAVLGVIAPFFLGWAVAVYFLPDSSMLVHAFVGATLCATSVGITARVLKDMGKIRAKESQIILGAAVIDDVLGLLVLTIISGIIAAAAKGQELELMAVAKIIGLSVGFLVAALAIGNRIAPYCFRLATFLRSHGILLATSLVFCFGLSLLAAIVGLAPIVGAFTAGLILEEIHYKDLSKRNHDASIQELIAPITALLVPIFFVLMGAKVDISRFLHIGIIGFASALTVAAILGKQVCAFGVREKGLNRLVVGLGMIPRGEVGLIFAGVGLSLTLNGQPVIDSSTYGAVVFMVILTTMVTPPLVKWQFMEKPKVEELNVSHSP